MAWGGYSPFECLVTPRPPRHWLALDFLRHAWPISSPACSQPYRCLASPFPDPRPRMHRLGRSEARMSSLTDISTDLRRPRPLLCALGTQAAAGGGTRPSPGGRAPPPGLNRPRARSNASSKRQCQRQRASLREPKNAASPTRLAWRRTGRGRAYHGTTADAG